MDNKTFLSHLAKRTGYDSATTGRFAEALTSTLSAVLADLNSAAIPGFGTFESVKTDERVQTDSNGRRMLLPPAISVRFNPSVVLRNKLRRL